MIKKIILEIDKLEELISKMEMTGVNGKNEHDEVYNFKIILDFININPANSDEYYNQLYNSVIECEKAVMQKAASNAFMYS